MKRIIEKDYLNLMLCSDLHLGNILTDEDRLKEDLEKAKYTECRILIFGDVIDAVFHTDKRYQAGTAINRIAATDAQLDESLNYAIEILEPYAEYIDMISMGNHERTILQKSQSNLTAALVKRLNENPKANITYGGWSGFVTYVLRDITGKRSKAYKIYYEHGSSGSSQVNKGTNGLSRAMGFIDADMICMGHDHNKTVSFYPLQCCNDNDKEYVKMRKGVRTGSYLRRNSEDIDHIGYAEAKGLSPAPIGGVFARLILKRHYSSDMPSCTIESTVEL